MFYDDDDWDDPNLYLPNYFITCFSPEQLTMYRQAIDKYAERHPQHGMDIDTSGLWNPRKDPAFLCYNRGSLTEFWAILDSIRKTAN